MKIITINLPFPYLKAIQDLIDKGKYNFRSEFIREALDEFLHDELDFFMDVNETSKFKKFMNCEVNDN